MTQLVVRRGYRERGVATGMLRRLGEGVEVEREGEGKGKGVDVWGVASCNPAAVLAVGGLLVGSLLFSPFLPFFPSFIVSVPSSPSSPPPQSPPPISPPPPTIYPLPFLLSIFRSRTIPLPQSQEQNSNQLNPPPPGHSPRQRHRSRLHPPARRTHPPLLPHPIPSERETPGTDLCARTWERDG